MKKKIITLIGLALFVGAVAYNMQIVNLNDHSNKLTLDKIEAIASGGGECECECPDGNGSCTGTESCDCSSDWILYCDDVTVYC